jgi:hypothetical protein
VSFLRRKLINKYGELRKRLIRETELGLLIGLRFPERIPRIPTVQVGKGSFDPVFAQMFWEETLGDMSALARFARRNPHLMSPYEDPAPPMEEESSSVGANQSRI